MIIILILIILAIFIGLEWINRRRIHHLKEIAPQDLKAYQGINLVRNGHSPIQEIGDAPGHRIHYLGLDSHHQVLFPESKFGNHRRYYLTATSFNPRLSHLKHPQPSRNVQAAANIRKAAYSDNAQQHSQVFLTLIKNDLSNAFKIELKAQQHDINVINQDFCLSAAQLKKLRSRVNNHKNTPV